MNSRQAMLKELMAAEFTCHEMGLFLDTHPEDERAAAYFDTMLQRARALHQQYESQYGPLHWGDFADGHWRWLDGPWPWEAHKEVK